MAESSAEFGTAADRRHGGTQRVNAIHGGADRSKFNACSGSTPDISQGFVATLGVGSGDQPPFGK